MTNILHILKAHCVGVTFPPLFRFNLNSLQSNFVSDYTSQNTFCFACRSKVVYNKHKYGYQVIEYGKHGFLENLRRLSTFVSYSYWTGVDCCFGIAIDLVASRT